VRGTNVTSSTSKKSAGTGAASRATGRGTGSDGASHLGYSFVFQSVDDIDRAAR